MANEKPKEGVKTEYNYHIHSKVVGQDGPGMQFKSKRRTPLSEGMKAYCERLSLPTRQIRFQFDRQLINETHTSQLDIEDEDTTGVFQQQTGGPATSLQNSVPPDQDLLSQKTAMLLHHTLTTTV
ncbi:Small ubiquitin-related modifier 2 [Myotis brandtii]|uniref:Small ubiquitin-related modifier 2 n=1 Tax=Myotis brandtii TaxID=109478 RepID=S7NB38_MYOBR|nr:Small ubiquitin-related modifier 2 [Myotis brandtii]